MIYTITKSEFLASVPVRDLKSVISTIKELEKKYGGVKYAKKKANK